jgi:hypothetical protein
LQQFPILLQLSQRPELAHSLKVVLCKGTFENFENLRSEYGNPPFPFRLTDLPSPKLQPVTSCIIQ